MHPPVEGDADLFEAVADAHDACLGRYPHGTMEVFAERGELEPLRPDVRVECKFDWLGTNHHVKGRFTNFLTQKDGKTKEATDEIETVLSEKLYQVYDATLHHLRICSPNAGLIPLTKLQPDRSWYTILGQPWTFPLRDPGYQAEVERYEVRRPDAKTVEIVSFRKGGVTETTKASLDWDWHVVEYHIRDAQKGDASGTFLWDRDRKGRVFLRERMATMPARGARIYEKLRVKSFDPDYQPPKSLFLSRIKPAAGTTVDDEIAHRRYRVGDTPVEAMGNRLDKLIELMRSEGFARPR